MNSTPRDRRAGLAGLAAVAGVLAASSCCLPVFPFLMAAGFAGGSAFLAAARPYLLGASVLAIAFGFYQARRAKQCSRRPRVVSSVLLWMSTVLVAISIFFPQAMASVGAGLLLSQPPAAQRPIEDLTPQSMAALGQAFNAARDDARVLVLFSPT